MKTIVYYTAIVLLMWLGITSALDGEWWTALDKFMLVACFAIIKALSEELRYQLTYFKKVNQSLDDLIKNLKIEASKND